ncbi:hypothetical protein PTKIN_Ptkin14bG0231400 [Pterospermum kingtungense]
MEGNAENRRRGSAESEVKADGIVENLKQKLESARHCLAPTKPPCIRRVPHELRHLNVGAFSAHLVYIGLVKYAHDFFEGKRMIFLDKFLNRLKGRATLNDFIHLILQRYADILHYYSEDTIYQSIRPDDEAVVCSILTDAVLIIEIFLRNYYKKMRDENDSFIFSEPWKQNDIQKELMLVEHQLPFFILTKMYNLAFEAADDFDFLHLTCHFFRRYRNQNRSVAENISTSLLGIQSYQPKHFTDILRALQLPYSLTTKEDRGVRIADDQERLKDEDQEQGEYLYSAVLLSEAGVKFKVDASRCLCDVTFNDRNGELIIPPLIIDDSTDSFFLNIMAWEQDQYYPHETYVCDFVFLMRYLMISVTDVDLLVRRKVIINKLGSNEAVVTMFNNLCRHIKVEKNHFSGLYGKINAYVAVPHHSWIANLKVQYFSNPWRSLATIAAVVLLLLTLIQTICSVISTN